MLLLLIFLLLPASVCLGWALFFTMGARRTTTYGIFFALFITLALFLFSDSMYAAPGMTPELLVYTRIIVLLTAPCLVPLVWLYMHQLKTGRKLAPTHYAWLLLPVFFVTAGGFLTQIAGVDAIGEFLHDVYKEGFNKVDRSNNIVYSYYIWTMIVFRIVLGIELVIAFFASIYYVRKYRFTPRHLIGFFRKGEKCAVLELQLFNLTIPAILLLVKIILSNAFLSEHLLIQIILSLVETMCIFNFAFVALCGAREKITRENMRHLMVYNYNPKIKSVIVEFTMDDLLEDAERDGLKRLQEKIGETLNLDGEGSDIKSSTNVTEMLFATMANTWDDDSLLSRFQHLMLNEQLFLQPGLSLGEVADKLHTNKTYVSKLVNNTYNLGFPELLNTLRIDYAEQYLITHKNAKQTEVAEACGFQSASSFNSIFKKVTGMTPKVWIASLDQNNLPTNYITGINGRSEA